MPTTEAALLTPLAAKATLLTASKSTALTAKATALTAEAADASTADLATAKAATAKSATAEAATSLTTLATQLTTTNASPTTSDGEGLNVGDIGKRGQDRKSDIATIRRNYGLDLQLNPFIDKGDLRLESYVEGRNCRSNTENERSVDLIRHCCCLSIEQGYFGSKQDIGTFIGLSRLDKEERFNIRQNSKSDLGTNFRIEVAEIRHTNLE